MWDVPRGSKSGHASMANILVVPSKEENPDPGSSLGFTYSMNTNLVRGTKMFFEIITPKKAALKQKQKTLGAKTVLNPLDFRKKSWCVSG